ncbi:DUF6714 family protein [Pseudomonas turukhanskensis]|uniref:Uncharacterized protein n=1 Tax=Pseudomonas turukhanskensis TaxID=1806536 RepID=A0A9W6NF22_9PSED|nr:DUF6714 family protein [Pseudomonas turukhanskensis]GLK88543.1 hypothetical protein GCM10017655_16050 [Pseudomonas turukhanskensis]
MSTDSQVIANIVAAFANVERPQHFCNYLHCEECAEHDAVLVSHDRETLTVDHVANPGWDPIGFCSAQGKAYYLPSLAQFALQGSADDSPYLMQLIHHLEGNGARNALVSYCSQRQRRAVAAFLEHVVETRTPYLADNDPFDQVLRTYGYWSADT